MLVEQMSLPSCGFPPFFDRLLKSKKDNTHVFVHDRNLSGGTYVRLKLDIHPLSINLHLLIGESEPLYLRQT